MEHKLRIELNDSQAADGKVYCAIGLGGGFLTREYTVDGKKNLGNYSFYNVFFQYLRLIDMGCSVGFDVLKTSSVIMFEECKENIVSTLNSIINTLLTLEVSEEVFQQAKEKSIKAFENQYKKIEFRAYYKSYEVSDLHKRFMLSELIEDIQTISYEDFTRIKNDLISVSNMCVYVYGDTTDIVNLDGWHNVVSEQHVDGKLLTFIGYDFDPAIRNDSHIIELARENFNLSVLSFDFYNNEATPFAKKIIVDFIAASMRYQKKESYVDAVDASIIVQVDSIDSLKENVSGFTEDTFEKAKKEIIRRYVCMMKNSPDIFSVEAVNLMLIGIYIDQYLEYISSLTLALFNEIYSIANCKLTEAQLLFRKESK